MIVQLGGCLWETEKMKKSGIKGRMIAVASVGFMCMMALSLLAPTVSAASATWNYEFPLGAARSQAVVLQDTNGVVYVLGGTSDFAGFTGNGACYAYNPGTGTWVAIDSLLQFVRGASGGIGNDGRIYFFSGWRTTITAPTPYMEIYNITTDTWAFGASDIPIPVREAKCFNAGDHMYVVGGEPNGAGVGGMNQIYNVTTDSWWVGAEMPQNRTSGATVVHDGFGYYFGGVNETDDPVATVFRYNIAADSWAQVASMPGPMCAQAAVIGQDGQAYVFGGANSASNHPSETYGTGYTYNFDTDTWTTIDDMNVPRAWLGAAVHDNLVLSIGGSDDSAVLTTVESLDTLPNQIANLQKQVTLLQNQLTQANDDISNLNDQLVIANNKTAQLKQQLVDLSAELNQTMLDLNAAQGSANNAKSAADSANMIGMIGIIIGIVAIVIAVIALVMKKKAPIQQMQPMPPMPPQ